MIYGRDLKSIVFVEDFKIREGDPVEDMLGHLHILGRQNIFGGDSCIDTPRYTKDTLG